MKYNKLTLGCALAIAVCYQQAANALPAQPTLAWMASDYTLDNQNQAKITVNWNMWWGSNGNLWQLKQNGAVVHQQSLTANGNNAQSGSHTLTLTAAGKYDLSVALCEQTGQSLQCNDSAITQVSVAGSAGTPGSFDPWTDLSMAGWPTPLKQANQPYQNTSNKMVGAYFVEWGIYGRNFHAADIPSQNLTHLFYGFIPVCGPNKSLQEANPEGYAALVSQCNGKQNYQVVVHDKFAALEKSYAGDQWDQPIRGIFAQLYRLKRANPNLKILPSVGGWTLSDPLYHIGTNAQARAVFITSIIAFIEQYDFFDGIDIDWEFPGGGGANGSLGSSADGEGFATLMKELRSALDALGQKHNRQYQLTAAMSGGVEKLSRIPWAKTQQYMDFINLMTYDYYGAWNGTLGHQTGLYPSQHPAITGFSADEAVNYLLGQQVPAAKVTLGAAMYGRGWTNVQGATNADPFIGSGGAGISGSWEKGIEDYKVIESKYLGGAQGTGANGFSLGWDDVAKASYAWNASTKTLVSFDSARSVFHKGQYVLNNQLGGLFAWEIDADNGQILNAMHRGLNHPLVSGNTDPTPTPDPLPTLDPEPTPDPTPDPTPNPDPVPSDCVSVEPAKVNTYPNFPQLGWDGQPSHANGGDYLRYQQKIYRANWWSNSVPGSDGSWTFVCNG